MSILGWILAVCGFAGLVFGLRMMLKGKKMNAVPFRAPSEIARLGPGAADAKGLVSTEGHVAEQGLMVAPMSGRPCLAFEITVSRKWEKSERTENGTSKTTGSNNLLSDYRGGIFPLNDGQGQVLVDTTEKPDAPFEQTHSSKIGGGILGLTVIPGTLQFGNFQMNTPSLMHLEGSTTGFEGVEKIVPPSPNLYALGAIAPGPHGPVLGTPKGIGTGKLVLSHKGRASLAGSTKRNMILGYAIGGVLFVGGTALGIFGPAPEPSASSACSSTLSDVVACDGRMYERDGKDFAWTVTTAGDYTLTVTQPKVKHPVDATLTIKDATGRQVGYNDGGSPGAPAVVKAHFEPGTYTVNVRDFAGDKVKGGYGFHLDVAKGEDPAAIGSAVAAKGAATTNGTAAIPAVATAKLTGAGMVGKPSTTAAPDAKDAKDAGAPSAANAKDAKDAGAPAAKDVKGGKDAGAPAAPAAKKK